MRTALRSRRACSLRPDRHISAGHAYRLSGRDPVYGSHKSHLSDTLEVLENLDLVAGLEILTDTDVAKVSVVGAGMESHPGIAAKMFEALFESDINIQMIATSEIKISVLIDADQADQAVRAVHDKFLG